MVDFFGLFDMFDVFRLVPALVAWVSIRRCFVVVGFDICSVCFCFSSYDFMVITLMICVLNAC